MIRFKRRVSEWAARLDVDITWLGNYFLAGFLYFFWICGFS